MRLLADFIQRIQNADCHLHLQGSSETVREGSSGQFVQQEGTGLEDTFTIFQNACVGGTCKQKSTPIFESQLKNDLPQETISRTFPL